ncbi:protein SODIUM POTASSIUM ROOT DEFECTIVE 1-like [Carica papaya]|uniref:protein SODIUM POTASSIUM ROOT DEFECTIVE 1-like n=1 Tax=Carica papaya TaxID=3649 RepID=UPI000B8CBC56|nr:protein SODIUM POTASSIUM ROOT DEFECTIVE 1-like [Carica papaya]
MKDKNSRKRLRGFMCQSTAVCMAADPRSSVKLPANPTHSSPDLPLTLDSHNHFQVVVMRVSLHCQGCAGKVKKHLSKMEGVTSFSIDLEKKMVTVMGHVSPVGVLESLSKVKKAEFWPI